MRSSGQRLAIAERGWHDDLAMGGASASGRAGRPPIAGRSGDRCCGLPQRPPLLALNIVSEASIKQSLSRASQERPSAVGAGPGSERSDGSER
jgi:hypothetical protein